MLNKRIFAAMLTIVVPSVAFAEDTMPAGPGALMQVLFLGGFVLIFYFLVWRPQSKRAKEHRELVGGLSKGDEVLVNGGIAGKIVRVKDDFLVVEISDNVEIKVQKAAVTTALPKGTLKDI